MLILIFFRKAEGKVGCFVAFGLEDAPPKDTLRRRLPLELVLAKIWAVKYSCSFSSPSHSP